MGGYIHHNSNATGDLECPGKLNLLFLKIDLLWCLYPVLSFLIHAGFLDHFAVICLTDVHHSLPVILVNPKYKAKDGNKNDRR